MTPVYPSGCGAEELFGTLQQAFGSGARHMENGAVGVIIARKGKAVQKRRARNRIAATSRRRNRT